MVVMLPVCTLLPFAGEVIEIDGSIVFVGAEVAVKATLAR
jgi:hypothetical protein